MTVSEIDKKNGISKQKAQETIKAFFKANNCAGQKLLFIIPDNTRSGPIGEIFQLAHECLKDTAANIDILIALGTHQPMTEQQICKRLSITPQQRNENFPNVKFFNHEWHKPETFKSIGKITAEQIEEISNGIFSEEVDVSINKLIYDYDQVIILGPVFPHEVVGFSGGHKYIFPGIAGAEIINFFHWLGAVITNPWVNGNKWTPTRKVVEQAASFIDIPRKLIALVAAEKKLNGLFCGNVNSTWQQAADLSNQVHIVYKEKPFDTVLGIAPQMYDDIWTAGKVMYKLEPIVADGGTLIIYAPHIDEVSYSHGKIIDEIGYHTRDYFLKQWDKFSHYPRGVTAHSTHVKGIGTYENGIEKPRVNVVLATAIQKKRCDKINLGYMNPEEIVIEEYRNQEHKGTLVVDHAGEMLHRLKNGQIPTIPGDRHN
jgi:nickel-dependent lactate racemase